MAPSSTLLVQRRFKYDVFLSFRGEDTRKNFVDHLYSALQQRRIETYKDDEKIKKGKRIGDELFQSIEESKFYIIVFSKNYASSSWCLDELVKIMEYQNMTEHTAYPIFYDVEPSEVRKQSGAFGEAFAKYENEEAVQNWREALKEVADLAGWELKNTADGHEAKFIQKIVEQISLELRSINSSEDGKLVGMETRIRDFVSSLDTVSNDVCMIGIKGIGGGGKTTLARAVYDQISFQFEGKAFVENVREVSKASSYGLSSLQEKVILDALNDKQQITISSVYEGKNMIKKMMCGRQVLIVLDDVDHIDQLEALAGEPNWFKAGSKIIITTRDEQVLVAHRVNLIRDVNLLTDTEATCLFSRYAFGTQIPIQGYEGLSGQVVRYAAGLPLTIRVLGSFLCGKYESEWIDALERLKEIPLKETLVKLELSYENLEADYKQIFLDVAYILKGWQKDDAIRVLESRGFHARNGLKVLEQKSLITISKYNYLGMHDHIEEMGRNIVRRSHPNEPNKHSRLWIGKEINDILANDLGTEATRCIKLSSEELNPKIVLKGLGNMKKLQFLHVDRGSEGDCVHTSWKFDETSQYFPNALRYLSWYNYPFYSLPKTFQASNLVALQMPFSKIVQLREEGERKVLDKLRFLNLRSSLLRILDLGMSPNLETLILKYCMNFVELHMPAKCPNLRFIDLSFSKVRTLDLGLMPNLETLNIKNCEDFIELHMPVECLKLRTLNLVYLKLRTLDFGLTPNLKTLNVIKCHDLVELHICIPCLKLRSINLNHIKMRTLDLGLTRELETVIIDGCDDLVELYMPPECLKLTSFSISDSKLKTLDLRLAQNLETLSVEGCHELIKLCLSIGYLNLRCINLCYSKLRTFDLSLTPNIEKLCLICCFDLVELHMPIALLKLTYLDFSYSNLRTLDIGPTPNIERLIIDECDDLVELRMPLEFSKLKYFSPCHSKLKTFDLGLTPNLKTLCLAGCHDFVELQMSLQCLNLRFLDLSHSKLRTFDLGQAPNLETLSLAGCDALVELHMPVGCLKLTFLDLSRSKLRTIDLGLILNLEKLSLAGCHDLVELHMPVECLNLRFLYLSRLKLRTLDIGLTPNLKELDLKDCHNLVELNAPIGCLKKLAYLELSGCSKFKSFLFDKRFKSREIGSLAELHLIAESLDICPLHSNNNLPKFQFTVHYKEHPASSFGNLEKLISVGLCPCTNLETFSGSTCGLQSLRKLKLEGNIPEVPKDLVQLECLEELTLLSASIKLLPDSICMFKYLKYLELKSCRLLEKLPEDLGRLECLEKLILEECILLRDIPNSICMMKHLKYFCLRSCRSVKKLPKELGRLKCLEELNIQGTSISRFQQIPFWLKGLPIVR